jgi:hypothetical protein
LDPSFNKEILSFTSREIHLNKKYISLIINYIYSNDKISIREIFNYTLKILNIEYIDKEILLEEILKLIIILLKYNYILSSTFLKKGEEVTYIKGGLTKRFTPYHSYSLYYTSINFFDKINIPSKFLRKNKFEISNYGLNSQLVPLRQETIILLNINEVFMLESYKMAITDILTNNDSIYTNLFFQSQLNKFKKNKFERLKGLLSYHTYSSILINSDSENFNLVSNLTYYNDFRGRIYPKSNFINQTNIQLVRSSLYLHDNNPKLTDSLTYDLKIEKLLKIYSKDLLKSSNVDSTNLIQLLQYHKINYPSFYSIYGKNTLRDDEHMVLLQLFITDTLFINRVDAKSRGAQHLSILFRNRNAGYLVGVYDTPEIKEILLYDKDYYYIVGKLTLDSISNYISNTNNYFTKYT